MRRRGYEQRYDCDDEGGQSGAEKRKIVRKVKFNRDAHDSEDNPRPPNHRLTPNLAHPTESVAHGPSECQSDMLQPHNVRFRFSPASIIMSAVKTSRNATSPVIARKSAPLNRIDLSAATA